MRKKLCLILAVMLLLLSACGGKKGSETAIARNPGRVPATRAGAEATEDPTQPETAVPDQMADSPERAAYAAYYASWLPGSPGS